MNLFESSEDYLERILMLKEKKGMVRAVDIANDMNYTKASVSIVLKKLKESDFIEINKGSITLTEKGHTIASSILERHNLLTKALVMLGVPFDIASKDACKIEHDLSKESYDAIKKHLKNQ